MIPGSLGIIPARLGSSRLARKPLHRLAGRPLIEWVWRRVSEAAIFHAVVVATDSAEVADAIRSLGGVAEITDPSHPSGTDRVAEVARMPAYRDHPLIVNVQGDEPFVRAGDLHAAARLVKDHGWQVGTVASPIQTAAEMDDTAVVKVVRGDRGQALYFSRAPIPYPRDLGTGGAELGTGLFLRHIGLYAYSREALLRWVALPEGDLERVERLEQLRPLTAGISIGVGIVEPGQGGVDTQADADRAERLLLRNIDSGASHGND